MKLNRIIKNILILIIIASNIGCDQVSKSIVRQKIEYNAEINVIGNYFILTKVENTGAFLGLGNSIPRPIYKLLMIIIPLLVLGYALFYLFTKNNISTPVIIAISLIISGGLGNIYDRIIYGSVTDFIHFDFVIFKTGILNLADISVTAGFFIILYELLIKRKKLISNTAE
jgi:signal peptidase II